MTNSLNKLRALNKTYLSPTVSIIITLFYLTSSTIADNIQQTGTAPVLLFPLDTTFYEDDELLLSHDFILSAIYDADHNDSLLTITITADSGLVFYWFDSNSQTHKFWANKDVDSCGYFQIRVEDPSDSVLIENFTVDILPVNDAPILQQIPDTTANQDSIFSILLMDYWSDADNDFTEMSWTIGAIHSETNLYGDSLVCVPDSGYTGWDTLYLSAGDPDGLTARDTFRIFFRDASPPSFVVGIFQNPVASEHLDIYFFPDEAIDSLFSTLVNNDSLDAELLTAVNPAPYHSHYRLDDNGTKTLQITAADTSGNSGTTQYDFSASLISKSAGGSLFSPDSLIQLNIPAESASNDYYSICLPNTDGTIVKEDLILTNEITNSKNTVYHYISPVDYFPNRCKITFYPDNPNIEYGIIQRINGNWTEPETFCDARKDRYWTYAKKLGTFAIIANPGRAPKPVPEGFTLAQNYPNPFNAETIIRFEIPEINTPSIEITIFDLLGHEIDHIIPNTSTPGEYSIRWNASNLASGVYFYTVKAGQFQETRKMVLVK